MLTETPILFHSRGVPLVGRFFRNVDNLVDRQPAVVVTGSWLTVKEQMPTVYGRRLAELGYTAFVFDFAGFGESGGTPRQAEMPARKMADIAAAHELVSTLSFVEPGGAGHLAICASAQYTLAAIARGVPVRSFASVAGWYHDAASVATFYGGTEGVALRLERAREAVQRFAESGEATIVPAYEAGNDRAGMSFRLDYYGNSSRGAVPAWKNEMAEMTWLYWLTFDGLSGADRVATPTLLVHGDGCVLPEHVKQIHARLQGPKELVWTEGDQVDFYDLPDHVDRAMSPVADWFGRTLKG
jgi:uncharacterized protein